MSGKFYLKPCLYSETIHKRFLWCRNTYDFSKGKSNSVSLNCKSCPEIMGYSSVQLKRDQLLNSVGHQARSWCVRHVLPRATDQGAWVGWGVVLGRRWQERRGEERHRYCFCAMIGCQRMGREHRGRVVLMNQGWLDQEDH